jgi:hypothetical protein
MTAYLLTGLVTVWLIIEINPFEGNHRDRLLKSKRFCMIFVIAWCVFWLPISIYAMYRNKWSGLLFFAIAVTVFITIGIMSDWE